MSKTDKFPIPGTHILVEELPGRAVELEQCVQGGKRNKMK